MSFLFYHDLGKISNLTDIVQDGLKPPTSIYILRKKKIASWQVRALSFRECIYTHQKTNGCSLMLFFSEFELHLQTPHLVKASIHLRPDER